MEALCVGSSALRAVIVYRPAVCGAVNVTGLPLEVLAELNEPPAGLELQVTPVVSLVVAVSSSCCPTVRPAWRGETVIEILPALMVSGRVTDALSGLPLESVTRKVSERWLAVADGVPEMAPVEAASDRPDGSDPPVSVHL